MSESVISKDTAVDVKAQTIDRRRLHDRTLRQFTQALLTCPPKTGPGVMLVTWAGERGSNAKEEVYTRAVSWATNRRRRRQPWLLTQSQPLSD